jgi:hypothetical protein
LISGGVLISAKRSLLSCLGLVALTGLLRAEPPLPLDLIPEEAAAGFGARSLADLRTKGDRLFAKVKGDAPRPSMILDMLFGQLNLPWKVDEKKPAAIVIAAGTLGGFAAEADPDKNVTIGAVLAPRDLAEVARAYKVTVEDLKKGGVHKVPGKNAGPFPVDFGTDQAGFRAGYVYLTSKEKATAALMKARTLRQALPAARQRRLDAADLLMYYGPALFQMEQKRLAREVEKPGKASVEDEAERRLQRFFLEVRNVLAAARLDDGLGVDLSVGFDPKGPQSPAVLKAIADTGRSTNLAGLPDSERLVGAFAAVGLGAQDPPPPLRVLAGDLWSVLKKASGLPNADATLVRRLFGDLYGRVRLARLALYQCSEPHRCGQLAAVAILEVDNPELFLKDVARWVPAGKVEQLAPKAAANKAEIEKLIADLGADDFAKRQAAGARLKEIGEAALPYLEKAEQSSDAEVRRRAGELLRTHRTAGDRRKQELVKGLLGKAFRPTFTLQLNAEKQAGADVHLLGVRFEDKDNAYPAALADLFGPQWNRLRLAVVGKRVVVLLGSDLPLLEQAIANVRDGKPGLEQSAALTEFHKQAAPERRIELHLALGRLRALFTPAADLPMDFKPTGACSSVSLWTKPAELGADLWIPADALADLVK